VQVTHSDVFMSHIAELLMYAFQTCIFLYYVSFPLSHLQ